MMFKGGLPLGEAKMGEGIKTENSLRTIRKNFVTPLMDALLQTGNYFESSFKYIFGIFARIFRNETCIKLSVVVFQVSLSNHSIRVVGRHFLVKILTWAFRVFAMGLLLLLSSRRRSRMSVILIVEISEIFI